MRSGITVHLRTAATPQRAHSARLPTHSQLGTYIKPPRGPARVAGGREAALATNWHRRLREERAAAEAPCYNQTNAGSWRLVGPRRVDLGLQIIKRERVIILVIKTKVVGAGRRRRRPAAAHGLAARGGEGGLH